MSTYNFVIKVFVWLLKHKKLKYIYRNVLIKIMVLMETNKNLFLKKTNKYYYKPDNSNKL